MPKRKDWPCDCYSDTDWHTGDVTFYECGACWIMDRQHEEALEKQACFILGMLGIYLEKAMVTNAFKDIVITGIEKCECGRTAGCCGCGERCADIAQEMLSKL